VPGRFSLGQRGQTPPPDLITATQVHGATVLFVDGDPPRLSGPDGDAILTARPDTCVGVRTADCLPILLHTLDYSVVGAVHAGWRGTMAGMGPAAVAAFSDRFGIAPSDLSATLGPAIGPCCYEVGDDVTGAVAGHHPEWMTRVLNPGPKGRPHLDLPELNRLQLLEAGVEQVGAAGDCSCCNPERYESYRRDGERSGRMVSWIRSAS